MNKSELRKLYIERRASMSAAEVLATSRHIADRFFENTDLTAIFTLHTFIRIGKFNEIDTSIIYYKLWRDYPEIVTAAPRLDLAAGKIESVAFDASTDWTESRWGIREPAGGEPINAGDIDLVIVPLLCFDESGYRVGYGKGYYDKFLSTCRPDCLKIGLSYFPQVAGIDDVADYDVGLDRCVTPFEVLTFGK